ncbi:MAG: hypothetical protein K6D94_00205, partial [Clostridiales bacterium]|nr:hypothetical protein [Clostridiales bacterium]
MENKLTIYTPVTLYPEEEKIRDTVEEILARHRDHGLDRFLLSCPSKGWRAVHYPNTEHYETLARRFAAVRGAVAPYGIVCGWWMTVTVKAGRSPEFQAIVRSDGSEAPFSSCPLDVEFRRKFASNAVLFARIARPAFIFTEDDYSISASSWDGCFCPLHLKELAAKTGREYSREELVSLLGSKTPEGAGISRVWKEISRDSLVGLARALRAELDKETPEIPVGFMEPGGSVADGDTAEVLSRVLAGPRHTPVCRIYGTEYNGIITENLPVTLYHPLWQKERIAGPFRFIHESDTYPHTRFYSSAAQMRALMGAVYSFGYEGSVFQTQQFNDDPGEEDGFAAMLSAERARFAAVSAEARRCVLAGVSVPADAVSDGGGASDWIPTLWRFGIPFTSRRTNAAFWDARRAGSMTDRDIADQLSKGLFLDAEAAGILEKRGYGKYLGVSVGESVITGMLKYDLEVRERIRDGFAPDSAGRDMPGANCYPGRRRGGDLRELTVTDPKCETVTETYDFTGRMLAVSMTRFENELGGRVVVYGSTLRGNESQSLWNYRRRKLFQSLTAWLGGDLPMVREAPKVWPIVNLPSGPDAGFLGMVTLIDLSEDPADRVSLRLPATWRGLSGVLRLGRDGGWTPVKFSKDAGGVT